MKQLHILVLEDSDEDLMLVLYTLKQSDLKFDYVHVKQEHEYLRELDNSSPDIIISDYGLQGYNGLTALRDKKKRGMDCPFILVTGSLPDEIAVECIKAGADDYILKDRLNRLPDAVRQAMERKRSEAARKEAFTELLLSQKRLETAERMAKVGNWEWSVGKDEIVWSDEMYRVMGVEMGSYSPTIHSFMEFIFEEDREASMKVAESIALGLETKAENQFRIRTLDGETKMVRSIYRSNGKTPESGELKVFGTMQDITLQFLTEKALRELTEQLEEKVQERTEAYQVLNQQLSNRNEEMMDSINYAKLIQKALLAKLDESGGLVQGSIVIWLPRDIVSGDFYWKYQTPQYDFVAAVDCTGHGVPGALMSMIGHQLLNEVVIRNGITEPAEILRDMDMRVAKALHHHGGDSAIHDGMDMILCRIDRSERSVCFSGALRPMFYVRDRKTVEHKTSRQSIGSFRHMREMPTFDQTTISYQKGDMLYLTTDGYYDQFGGPKGKKMLKSKFRKLLSELAHLPINIQHDTLMEHLRQWQGTEDQVDDILIIGIQF